MILIKCLLGTYVSCQAICFCSKTLRKVAARKDVRLTLVPCCFSPAASVIQEHRLGPMYKGAMDIVSTRAQDLQKPSGDFSETFSPTLVSYPVLVWL